MTLPSESQVLESALVSGDKVGGLIRSDKFDAFVGRLFNDANKNILAQDVMKSEREHIENFFGSKARLRNFACGISVCAGTIAMGKDPSIYTKFSEDFMANGPQNTSLLDYRKRLDNGDFEQRFVMSVDSSMGGIRFRTQP